MEQNRDRSTSSIAVHIERNARACLNKFSCKANISMVPELLKSSLQRSGQGAWGLVNDDVQVLDRFAVIGSQEGFCSLFCEGATNVGRLHVLASKHVSV